jgi:hypothetical protein
MVLILWIITVHSFSTGIALLIIPSDFLKYFGILISTHSFFQAQGGIFHIVMCAAYIMAALNPVNNSHMILFVIIVKFTATLFLSVYYFFIEPAWIILFSAIFDGTMGMVLLLLNNQNKRSLRA